MLVSEILTKLFSLLDSIVELYLDTSLKPIASAHQACFSKVDALLCKLVDNHKEHIPGWVTVGFLSHGRLVVLLPTVLLLSLDNTIVPSLLILAVASIDILKVHVSLHWQNTEKIASNKVEKEKTPPRSVSPTCEDSFEIVTTGSAQRLQSWRTSYLEETAVRFWDNVSVKLFLLPCWVALLASIATTGYLHLLQYGCLISAIVLETANLFVCFRKYYTDPGTLPPRLEGFQFAETKVGAASTDKIRHSLEMYGTVLFILPVIRYLGLALLLLGTPLAYEAVRCSFDERVLYVNGNSLAVLDHKVMKFLIQTRSLGTKLVIGFSEKKTEMIMNACACSCIDEVIAGAPKKLDLMFLEKQGIDYVFLQPGEEQFVTDETLATGRCLSLGEDYVVRQVQPKLEKAD